MSTESDIHDLLENIENGIVTVRAIEAPAEIYHGVITYRSSDGWILGVFDDAGQWDYLASVQAPDNRAWQWEDLPADLRAYRPPEEQQVTIWQWSHGPVPERAVHYEYKWRRRC